MLALKLVESAISAEKCQRVSGQNSVMMLKTRKNEPKRNRLQSLCGMSQPLRPVHTAVIRFIFGNTAPLSNLLRGTVA